MRTIFFFAGVGGAQSLDKQVAPVIVLNQVTITFWNLMAPDSTPNPRVTNAFNAMRALGISRDEAKPVLQKLLKVYDKNWELIEEDNYRTLVDAYFELKEEKVTHLNISVYTFKLLVVFFAC